MKKPLEGKVALVTGAGIRLGRAIALGLAQQGAQVAVHFHTSRKGADETVASIEAAGGLARAFSANLCVDDEIDALVRQVTQSVGPIDVLVNSAAVFESQPFVSTDVGVLDRAWGLNARAPFILSQRVVRQMKEGDIVNVLDIGGVRQVWRNYSAYCMSKAALASLTECLALELAPKIRVNAVAPGTVLPPQTEPSVEQERRRLKVPQQRFGTPQDVVDAVLFLLTGPSFVTGHTLVIDGGRSLSSG